MISPLQWHPSVRQDDDDGEVVAGQVGVSCRKQPYGLREGEKVVAKRLGPWGFPS